MSLITARRALLVGIATFALAATAQAQSPTPEGTKIRNRATATYTDGATNKYTATDSVEVTVGFFADIVVPGTNGSQTPAAGGTGYEYTFDVTNHGNGIDSVAVSFDKSSADITIEGFKIGATTYADEAALNLALSALGLAYDAKVSITIVYSVAAGTGNQPQWIKADVTSRRKSTEQETHQLDIVPAAVAVTPDGTTLPLLPGQRKVPFSIENLSSIDVTYTLTAAATSNSAGLTVAGIEDASANGITTITVASGASVTVNVAVSIPLTASSTSSARITLTATSNDARLFAAITDDGYQDIDVTRPELTFTKEAWRGDRSVAITTADSVAVEEFIEYKLIVKNIGDASTVTLSIADTLPALVTYVSHSDDTQPGWTISEANGIVTASLASLAKDEERYFWIRVQIRK